MDEIADAEIMEHHRTPTPRWPYFFVLTPCWILAAPFVVLLGYPLGISLGQSDVSSVMFPVILWVLLGGLAALAFWRRHTKLGLSIVLAGSLIVLGLFLFWATVFSQFE